MLICALLSAKLRNNLQMEDISVNKEIFFVRQFNIVFFEKKIFVLSVSLCCHPNVPVRLSRYPKISFSRSLSTDGCSLFFARRNASPSGCEKQSGASAVRRATVS